METRLVAPINRTEQETCIAWLHDDEFIELYTSDSRIITKCTKAGYEVLVEGINQKCPEEHRIISKTFKVPVSCISFRKPAKRNANNNGYFKKYWESKKSNNT